MNHSHAFSLLELMAVLSIIAILTLAAYPSYTHHINRTQRSQAKLNLLQLAQALEHYHTEHHTYESALKNLPANQANNSSYQLIVLKLTKNEFMIQARPITQAGYACGSISINQTGQQSIQGNRKASCW
jgi:type IV pilus assembly protein PilE